MYGADNPFGPLSPLHRYIVRHAVPIDWDNWWKLVIIPCLPLGAQCLLILYPNTRPYRIVLGFVGSALILHALVSYRFVGIPYNIFNVGIAVGTLHLVGRYTEYALLPGPIVDPYVSRGRWRLVSAIDLAINSRMIGLESVAAEYMEGDRTRKDPPKPTNGHAETQRTGGDIQFKGHRVPSQPLAYLPRPRPPLGYLGTLRRHLLLWLKHYIIMDTMLWLAQYLQDATSIHHPHRGALAEIINGYRWTLFPGLPFAFEAPKLVIWIGAELLVFIATVHGLQTGYHAIALVAVGSRIWEAQSWDVDLFGGEPLGAQSLIELWGKRWHQLFRHHFLLMSAVIFRSIGLPPDHSMIYPLVFLFSGILHGLGGITMDPPPDPLKLVVFFSLSGVGCALEVAFRTITGKRVRGRVGRVWVWVWMLATARLLCEAYIDAGVGMASLNPEWAVTPGRYIGGFIKDWLFDVL